MLPSAAAGQRRVSRPAGEAPTNRLWTRTSAPTAQSKRVRLRGGKISVVDGPFTETKEVVGGYAMLDAQSLEEAIALTERFVELHVADGWELDCEVRQLHEPEFGC